MKDVKGLSPDAGRGADAGLRGYGRICSRQGLQGRGGCFDIMQNVEMFSQGS